MKGRRPGEAARTHHALELLAAEGHTAVGLEGGYDRWGHAAAPSPRPLTTQRVFRPLLPLWGGTSPVWVRVAGKHVTGLGRGEGTQEQ